MIFTMKAFRYVIQFWFSFLMVIIVVPVFSYIYTRRILFPGILLDILKGFIAGNAVGLLLPVQKLAERFAGLCKAKIGTFVYNLLTTFIYVSFYILVFSFFYTAIAIGFPSYFLLVVLKGIPLSFAVCYIIAIAINPIALKLSFWTCSKST